MGTITRHITEATKVTHVISMTADDLVDLICRHLKTPGADVEFECPYGDLRAVHVTYLADSHTHTEVKEEKLNSKQDDCND